MRQQSTTRRILYVASNLNAWHESLYLNSSGEESLGGQLFECKYTCAVLNTTTDVCSMQNAVCNRAGELSP